MPGVRIIGGDWRGRRLAVPPGLATRPLPDRIKQSLFDLLGDLGGAQVADICAGSGSFGFEAASRGAIKVHLAEIAPAALAVLTANRQRLGDPAQVVIHPQPGAQVLDGLRGLDLVFCDPPFPWYVHDRPALAALLAAGLTSLRAGGWLLLRGERGCVPPPLPAGLIERDHRTWGRSWVRFLQVDRP